MQVSEKLLEIQGYQFSFALMVSISYAGLRQFGTFVGIGFFFLFFSPCTVIPLLLGSPSKGLDPSSAQCYSECSVSEGSWLRVACRTAPAKALGHWVNRPVKVHCRHFTASEPILWSLLWCFLTCRGKAVAPASTGNHSSCSGYLLVVWVFEGPQMHGFIVKFSLLVLNIERARKNKFMVWRKWFLFLLLNAKMLAP